MLLKDRIVWVTGASGGIGRSTALKLASEGATLILAGRQEERLHAVAEEIRASGASACTVFAYDVANQEEVQQTFKEAAAKYGRLDGMVNNAGILEESLLSTLKHDHLQRVFSVNVFGTLYHMQMASRLMMRKKQGSIVNISSIIGSSGKEGLSVYGASKAAVNGAVKSAAKELAPFGIRVNAVAPGFIATDMTGKLKEDIYRMRMGSIKMKRAGLPEEVADTVLYLLSDLSKYVTGQTIGVDGGMVE
ncbi:SDR family NAD(P)-dependent oxidoreductase [Saccharibacillus sacchari]|uniref:SDR family NAD(P)-dependent oxidoreductase n=1 Tax=Saccharibacillus sacchari TaxID=456493 RepID=UPI0004B62B95|nr:SDR family NAD(P)-dependent oxidoreductase [Saccharibacillus sacchari]